MESGISRLFDEFFRDFGEVGFDFSPNLGRTDIYEKDRNLVFETELPGMKREDIEIKVEDGKLSISGEIKRAEEVDEDNYFRIGRRYGQFQRSFPLPVDMVDTSNIKARFADGILKVTLPLKESIKEKEKPIRVEVE
jgi:HSP20 family protein